jgi:uncharacterized membrane protein YccC
MKPKKKFRMLGTLIGIALWGSLAYLFYPHWSAWLFGGLLMVNTMVLIGQGVRKS